MPKPEQQILQTSVKEALRQKSRKRRDGNLAATPVFATRNDLLPLLKLVQKPIGELIVSERKLRRLEPAHVREVAASIAQLGFSVPVLIDDGGRVIDGESRIEAAKLLGLALVSCIVVTHLSATERRLLRIAINRQQEKGTWDLFALKLELQELIIENAPVEIAGFSLPEIDQILLEEESTTEAAAELEPQANAIPVARLGDRFVLGDHIVICGDATLSGFVTGLMGKDMARLILTDEPYNVKISGHVTGGSHREFVMASGEMSDQEFRTFNDAWMNASIRHLRDGGVFGTFIDWRGYPTVHLAATALSLTPLNLAVWNKTNAGMGSLYRSQHELLPLFKKGNAPHVNNVELGKNGRWRSNVWTYAGASSLGSDARRGLEDHPTVKPVAMLEDALLDLTKRGDLVLDPFLGSGSTLIAAEKTGRLCRGLELDPAYVDVIVRRFERLTGRSATLAESGETFAEVSERRRRECEQTAAEGASMQASTSQA